MGMRHINCNAFDLIKGKTCFTLAETSGNSSVELGAEKYDLIYSTGLYDYLAVYPMNPMRGATGLTRKLFDMLKPGGRAVFGNFLKPRGENLHRIHHHS